MVWGAESEQLNLKCSRQQAATNIKQMNPPGNPMKEIYSPQTKPREKVFQYFGHAHTECVRAANALGKRACEHASANFVSAGDAAD